MVNEEYANINLNWSNSKYVSYTIDFPNLETGNAGKDLKQSLKVIFKKLENTQLKKIKLTSKAGEGYSNLKSFQLYYISGSIKKKYPNLEVEV